MARIFRPEVERYRPFVERYFMPADVDKALWVIDAEHAGDPRINVLQFNSRGQQVGPASGLFQIEGSDGGTAAGRDRPTMQELLDPETNVRMASFLVYNTPQGWGHWGEGPGGRSLGFGGLGKFKYVADQNASPPPTPWSGWNVPDSAIFPQAEAAPPEPEPRVHTASAGAAVVGDTIGPIPEGPPMADPKRPWEQPLPDDEPKPPLTPADIMNSADFSPNDLGRALTEGRIPGGWDTFQAEMIRRYGPPGQLRTGGPNTTAQILTQWGDTLKAVEESRGAQKPATRDDTAEGSRTSPLPEPEGGFQAGDFGRVPSTGTSDGTVANRAASLATEQFPGAGAAQVTAAGTAEGGGAAGGGPGAAKPSTTPARASTRTPFVSETDKRKQEWARIEGQLGNAVKSVERAADGTIIGAVVYNPQTEKAQRLGWDSYNDRYATRGDPFTLTQQMITSAVQDQVWFNRAQRAGGRPNPRLNDRIFTDTGSELMYEDGVQRVPLGGPEGRTLRPETVGQVEGVPLYNLPFNAEGTSDLDMVGWQDRFLGGGPGAIPTSLTPAGQPGRGYNANDSMGLLMGTGVSPTGDRFGFGRTIGSESGIYSTLSALGYQQPQFADQAIMADLAAQAMIDRRVAAGEDRNAVVGGIRQANFNAMRPPPGYYRSPTGMFVNAFGIPFGGGDLETFTPGLPQNALPAAPLSYQEGGEFPPRREDDDPFADQGSGFTGVGALNPQFGTEANPPLGPGETPAPSPVVPSVPGAAVPSTSGEPSTAVAGPARITSVWRRRPDAPPPVLGANDDANWQEFPFSAGQSLNAEGNTEEENRAFASMMADIIAAGQEIPRLFNAQQIPAGLRRSDIASRQDELGAMQALEWQRPLAARFRAAGLDPSWETLGRRQGFAQQGRGLGINLADLDLADVQRAIDQARANRGINTDMLRLQAQAAGSSAAKRFADALAAAHASAQARAAIANQQQANADADAAARVAALGQTSAGSPWQGGLPGGGMPFPSGPAVNPATAGPSQFFDPSSFARGGSMTLPEPIYGFGQSGRLYFTAAENGPERVGAAGNRLRFEPIEAEYRYVA